MLRVPLHVEVRDDATAKAVAGAVVTVKARSNLSKVPLYGSRYGATSVPNPVTTDARGRALVWTEPADLLLVVGGTGITPYSVPADNLPEVVANSVTTTKIVDKGVAAVDLATPVYSIYRPIWTNSMLCGPGGDWNQKYYTQDGVPNSPNEYGTRAMSPFWHDPSDFAVEGMTTKWRLSVTYAVNAVSVGLAGVFGLFSFSLIRITGSVSVSNSFAFTNGVFTNMPTATTENILPTSVAHTYTEVEGKLNSRNGLFTVFAHGSAATNCCFNSTATVMVKWI